MLHLNEYRENSGGRRRKKHQCCIPPKSPAHRPLLDDLKEKIRNFCQKPAKSFSTQKLGTGRIQREECHSACYWEEDFSSCFFRNWKMGNGGGFEPVLQPQQEHIQ